MLRVPRSSLLLALQMTWPAVMSQSWQLKPFCFSVIFIVLGIESWQPRVSPNSTTSEQVKNMQQSCKLSNFSALINQKSNQTLRTKEVALAPASTLLPALTVIHLAKEISSVCFVYLQASSFAVAEVINLHIVYFLTTSAAKNLHNKSALCWFRVASNVAN